MSRSSDDTRYYAGTLEYTKRSLIVLFMWLLWGDFCFTLMETIEPSVLPLVLKDLGASNLIMSLYLTTFVGVFNLTICPISSFMSDRYRSKWGRRIPFLALSTPFVALFLVLTGFCKEIGHFFYLHVFHQSVSNETAVTIVVIGILVVCYQFFHMIVASVYYYLFNDVVPEQYLGRVMALFRAVGTAAGALFSLFVYQYARTHSKEIFVGFGLLYLIGFTMMCLKVREGEYPTPPKTDKTKSQVIQGIATFFKESYCHKFYWYFYTSFGFWAISGVTSPFLVFRNLNLGLSLKELGWIAGVSGVLTTVLLVPMGCLVDKKHPIRVGMTAMIWTLVFAPLNVIFLWQYSHTAVLWLTIMTTAVTLPVGVIASASDLPLFMRLLPHSRYGQFCSANAMVRSAMTIVAGVVCGLFVDGLAWYCKTRLHIGGDYYYRLLFIWQIVFVALALYYRVKLYKMWLSLGGDDNYIAPMFENDEIEIRKHRQQNAGNGDNGLGPVNADLPPGN
jgi:maltose/moltooligosaccharide transporter